MALWLWVFLVVLLLDYAWAHYTVALAQRRQSAPWWSSLLFVLSGAAAIEYVQDPWLLIPGAIACWLGTWLAQRPMRRLRPYDKRLDI